MVSTGRCIFLLIRASVGELIFGVFGFRVGLYLLMYILMIYRVVPSLFNFKCFLKKVSTMRSTCSFHCEWKGGDLVF